MVQANKATGICSTCNNLPTCAYFARRGPVFFCELYDDHAPSNAGPDTPSRPHPAPERTLEPDEEAPGLKGLCVNCDLRHTCTYPKAAGGIWHCEEYV
jgi:hypothetical protein